MSPLPTAPASTGAVNVAASCATCHSPLAADQLFCLSCGTRRRDARIAFRDVLATEAAPLVPVSGGGGGLLPPAGAISANAGGSPLGAGRIAYMPFLATLALLLFALGIGVWIGRKPVQAVAAPTAAAPVQAVVATTPAETTPTDAAASADSSAKDDASAKKDDAATDDSSAPVKNDTGALKNLEKLTPEQYQKQSQKLPSEVGTGGKAPEKDNKPAGGGSDFEDFN